VLYLSPNVRVIEDGSTLSLVTEDEIVEVTSGGALVRTVLDGLRRGSSAKQVEEELGSVVGSHLLALLEGCGVLLSVPLEGGGVGCPWARQDGWLAVHTTDPVTAQARLRDARVALVGVGGVGNVLVQHLVAAGVGHFSLIDPDSVVLEDLNRQYLFRRADVGRPKVEVATEAICATAPDADVRTWRCRVTKNGDLDMLVDARPDLVVLAADDPLRQLECTVANFGECNGVPITMAGVGLDRGYWGPLLIPGLTTCYRCWSRVVPTSVDAVQASLAANPGTPTPFSFGPVNSVVASLLARDVVLALLGVSGVQSASARIIVRINKLAFAVRQMPPCSCWRPTG
jgi:hypothetical protein